MNSCYIICTSLWIAGISNSHAFMGSYIAHVWKVATYKAIGRGRDCGSVENGFLPKGVQSQNYWEITIPVRKCTYGLNWANTLWYNAAQYKFHTFAMNKIHIFLWPCCTACGILVAQPEIEPVPPEVEVWSLSSGLQSPNMCWSDVITSTINRITKDHITVEEKVLLRDFLPFIVAI